MIIRAKDLGMKFHIKLFAEIAKIPLSAGEERTRLLRVCRFYRRNGKKSTYHQECLLGLRSGRKGTSA